MSVSIHYREDVSDRRGAERALAGQPPRSFITWRAGDSDADFCLTYHSQAFGRVEHVALRRGVDGSFRASDSRDEGAFRTLTDFVATRRYIDAAPAVTSTVGGERDATPAGAGATPAAMGVSEATGVRRRATAAVGGRAELPADLPLPAPRRPVARGSDGAGDDADAAAVPPTCRRGTQNAMFAVAGCCAVALAAWAVVEYREHECASTAAERRRGLVRDARRGVTGIGTLLVHRAPPPPSVAPPAPAAHPLPAARVLAHAATLTAAVAEVVADANAGVAAALAAAGPAGAQDAGACGAAAAAWRATLAAAAPRVQADFAGGDAPVFIRHALSLCLAALCGAWALLCVSTGKRAAPTADAPTEAELAADPDAAAVALGAGAPRDPPCTPMQARWAFAFSSLLGAAALSGFLAFNVLWEFGGPSKAVEYAARPLCAAHNWADAVNASSGEVAWRRVVPRPRRRGATADDDGGADPLPWPQGDFAAALHAVRASAACADAMQAAVAPLALMPPLLRVPLRAACPAPLHAALRAAAAALRRVRGGKPRAAAPTGGGGGDAFTVADPLAGTALRGWLDGDVEAAAASLVLPSHAGVSFAVVNVVFYVLLAFMATLMAADAAHARAPRWAEWWRVRGLRGRRAAAVAARSHVHAD